MSHPFASFYRGKRVLVTGHTGFTGGWLVAWLKLLGVRVCGYGLPPSSRPNFFDAILLDRGITSLFADVRDLETLSNAFADFQPEMIFHAAAQSQPGHDSLEPFSVNVSGTLNVLEEARLTACARVVVVLSDSLPAPRCAPLVDGSQASTDWLRATHAAAEMSALAFAESFFRESGTAVAIARLPGLIGGGDWAEFRFVPNLLRSLGSGEPIVFRNGFGRSYAHVLDAARACLHLAEILYTSRPAISRGWDFPAADPGEISEQDLAERFIEHWPGERTHRDLHQSAAEPLAAKSPYPAKVYPGWTPALSLDEAIACTMDWYQGYSADPASAWRMTEAQIEQYAKLPLSWTLTAADHRQADQIRF